MQIDYSITAIYVASVVTMIALPGPVMLLVTGARLAGGPRQALRTIFGTNAASLVLIALSALVLKGIFSVNETAFDLLKLAGGCYVGWLGWDMLRAARDVHDESQALQNLRTGGFIKGFAMAISNPKDIIFFASFFPQFINVTPEYSQSLVVLTALWIILDFATLMLVSHMVSRLLKPSMHQVMLRISGVLLMLIALGSMMMTLRSLV